MKKIQLNASALPQTRLWVAQKKVRKQNERFIAQGEWFLHLVGVGLEVGEKPVEIQNIGKLSRYQLRIKKDLHERVKEYAEDWGISVNHAYCSLSLQGVLAKEKEAEQEEPQAAQTTEE